MPVRLIQNVGKPNHAPPTASQAPLATKAIRSFGTPKESTANWYALGSGLYVFTASVLSGRNPFNPELRETLASMAEVKFERKASFRPPSASSFSTEAASGQ